nr:MAG TPA: hypothetical protein [Caudoviricetes sp.]DAS12192.1 MAG TPA: hypothetical protein [Caudoviricetes sp.]
MLFVIPTTSIVTIVVPIEAANLTTILDYFLSFAFVLLYAF